MRDRARAIYGYDDPLLVQYGRWVRAIAGGDFGWSSAQQRPALDVVLEALPNSLSIVLPGVALALLVGTVIGRWQGTHAGTKRDQTLSLVVFVLYGLPEYAIALLLLLCFSVIWPVLPSGGIVSDLHPYLPPVERVMDRLRHMVLPTVVIALFDAAALTRFQRQSMRDAIGQPFVRTAWAAGLPRRLVYRGAWRASLLPVLTMLGMLLPLNVLGVVFVEQVFAWPGLGLTLLNATTARDHNVVAACVIVQGLLIAVSTLAVELLREAADPRLITTGGDAPVGLAARP